MTKTGYVLCAIQMKIKWNWMRINQITSEQNFQIKRAAPAHPNGRHTHTHTQASLCIHIHLGKCIRCLCALTMESFYFTSTENLYAFYVLLAYMNFIGFSISTLRCGRCSSMCSLSAVCINAPRYTYPAFVLVQYARTILEIYIHDIDDWIANKNAFASRCIAYLC